MNANIRRRRVALMIVLAVSASAMVACLNINDPDLGPAIRYGAVAIKAHNGPASTGVATAVGIFFDATQAGIPDSRNQVDQCNFSTVDSSTSELTGVLMAGTSIGLKIGAQTSTIPYDPNYKRYSDPGVAYTYQLNDSAQLSVPGQSDGFPAGTVTVKLAQPIIPGPVTIPAADQPFNLTWNAVIDTTSAIVVQLRYASPPTSTYANQQVICALVDDGAYQVPANLLSSFLASPISMRSLVMTRWRTRGASLNATTLLHVVSSIDTTITFQ